MVAFLSVNTNDKHELTYGYTLRKCENACYNEFIELIYKVIWDQRYFKNSIDSLWRQST